jgi:hypothetical protein
MTTDRTPGTGSLPASYARLTDDAGITVEYRPLRDLKPGDPIIGGWRPHALVERIETNGDQGRVYFTTHGPGEWWPLDQTFPVVVDDPS